MDDGWKIIIFFLIIAAGLICLIFLRAVRKREPLPNLQDLDLEKDFYVWHTGKSSRMLMKFTKEGVFTTSSGLILWEDILEADVSSSTRTGNNLLIYVKDDNRKSGSKQMTLPCAGSRYSADYLLAVIELYRRKYR